MTSSDKSLCFLLLIYVCAVADTFGATLSNKTVEIIPIGNRIVGGSEANIHDFPYQLSLWQNNNFHCGASIATSRFALTAAHCFDASWKPERIHLRSGTNQRTTGFGYIHRAKAFFVHPRYKIYPGYDLALVQVWERFRWLPTVAPVKLPPPGFVVPNGAVTVLTGWGGTESGQVSDVLLSARLTVLGLQECLKVNPRATRREICAGTQTTNARGGDSGGPLVLNGVQVGVTSYTYNGVGGYINLADEVNNAWILSHIY